MIDELLDSTMIIDVLNGWLNAISVLREPKVRGISIVTWIEVMAGAMPDDQVDFEEYLSSFVLVEISPEIAALAAQLRRTLRLKLPDAVIYATALHLECTLLTRNTRDFSPDMPRVSIPYTLPS